PATSHHERRRPRSVVALHREPDGDSASGPRRLERRAGHAGAGPVRLHWAGFAPGFLLDPRLVRARPPGSGFGSVAPGLASPQYLESIPAARPRATGGARRARRASGLVVDRGRLPEHAPQRDAAGQAPGG